MRTLAIETSSKSVSVAILEHANLIHELNSESEVLQESTGKPRSNAGSADKLPAGYVRKRSKRGSKTSRVFPPGASVLLAPMIKSICEQTGYPLQTIELIAVTTGPGSFTGLRVGVVTAKTLAYSIQAQIMGVNSLEVIAFQTSEAIARDSYPKEPKRICPVINAQRNQVFAGYYSLAGESAGNKWRLKEVSPNEILSQDTWRNRLDQGDIVTGSGLAGVLVNQGDFDSGVELAPESCRACTAGTVGKLAWNKYESGKRMEISEIEPVYFRPSAAEEVRNAKMKQDVSK